MNKITVPIGRLVKALIDNRANHKKMYEEAMVGFCHSASRLFEDKLDDIRDGNVNNLSVHLSPPEDHTRDYDIAIHMLQWCVAEQIDLTLDEFRCYVEDDWDWIGAWLCSNRKFSTTASSYKAHLSE